MDKQKILNYRKHKRKILNNTMNKQNNLDDRMDRQIPDDRKWLTVCIFLERLISVQMDIQDQHVTDFGQFVPCQLVIGQDQ